MLAHLVASLAPPGPPPAPQVTVEGDGRFLTAPEDAGAGEAAASILVEAMAAPTTDDPSLVQDPVAPAVEAAAAMEIEESGRAEAVAASEATAILATERPSGRVNAAEPMEPVRAEFVAEGSADSRPDEQSADPGALARGAGSSSSNPGGELRAALQGAVAAGATPRQASAAASGSNLTPSTESSTVGVGGVDAPDRGDAPFTGGAEGMLRVRSAAESGGEPVLAPPDLRAVAQVLRELLEASGPTVPQQPPPLRGAEAAMIPQRLGVPAQIQSLDGAFATRLASTIQDAGPAELPPGVTVEPAAGDRAAAGAPELPAQELVRRPAAVRQDVGEAPTEQETTDRPSAVAEAVRPELPELGAGSEDAPTAHAPRDASATATQPAIVAPVAPMAMRPMSAARATPVGEMPMAAPPEPPTPPLQPDSQVTVVLDSAIAGANRIRVALRGDVVHATIVADVAAAVALTQRLPELQRALRDRGFTDAQLSVRVLGAEGVAAPAAMRTESTNGTSSPADARNESEPRQGQRRADPDGRQRQQSRHPEPEESA